MDNTFSLFEIAASFHFERIQYLIIIMGKWGMHTEEGEGKIEQMIHLLITLLAVGTMATDGHFAISEYEHPQVDRLIFWKVVRY